MRNSGRLHVIEEEQIVEGNFLYTSCTYIETNKEEIFTVTEEYVSVVTITNTKFPPDIQRDIPSCSSTNAGQRHGMSQRWTTNLKHSFLRYKEHGLRNPISTRTAVIKTNQQQQPWNDEKIKLLFTLIQIVLVNAFVAVGLKIIKYAQKRKPHESEKADLTTEKSKKDHVTCEAGDKVIPNEDGRLISERNYSVKIEENLIKPKPFHLDDFSYTTEGKLASSLLNCKREAPSSERNTPYEKDVFSEISLWDEYRLRPSIIPKQDITVALGLEVREDGVGKISEIECPNSLSAYFMQQESYDTDSKRDDYTFEWIRYKSFLTFPSKVPVFPARLARNGWYYTGKDDLTMCFVCGATHSNWRESETGELYHEENCSFQVESPINFPIHQEGNSKGIKTNRVSSNPEESVQSFDKSEIHNSAVTLTSSSGLAQLLGEGDSISSPVIQALAREGNVADTQNNYAHPSNDATPALIEAAAYDPPSMMSSTPSLTAQNSLRTSNFRNEAKTITASDSAHKPPRFPEYEHMSSRMDSFRMWTNGDKQNPRDLALAGFYCKGQCDHVQCHHCGVILRNWQKGDDAWVEHARWRPECQYVRRCRSDRFVEIVRKRAAEAAKESQKQASADRDSVSGDVLQQEHSAAATDNGSKVVQMIKDMGYTDGTVNEAINAMKRQLGPGRHRVTIHDVLETIFCMQTNNAVPLSEQSTEGARISNHPNVAEGPSESHYHDDSTELQEHSELAEQILCKICMEERVSMTFLPCGHISCCEHCSVRLKQCPICRRNIKSKVKTFLN